MSLKKGGILGSTVSLSEQMDTWLGLRSWKKTHSTMAAAQQAHNQNMLITPNIGEIIFHRCLPEHFSTAAGGSLCSCFIWRIRHKAHQPKPNREGQGGGGKGGGGLLLEQGFKPATSQSWIQHFNHLAPPPPCEQVVGWETILPTRHCCFDRQVMQVKMYYIS